MDLIKKSRPSYTTTRKALSREITSYIVRLYQSLDDVPLDLLSAYLVTTEDPLDSIVLNHHC